MEKKKSRGHVRVVDLFAGIGGLRTGATKGFEKMGYTTEVVFTSEIKKTAIATLKLNHPDEVIHGDITQVPTEDIPDHDLLLAGFPARRSLPLDAGKASQTRQKAPCSST